MLFPFIDLKHNCSLIKIWSEKLLLFWHMLWMYGLELALDSYSISWCADFMWTSFKVVYPRGSLTSFQPEKCKSLENTHRNNSIVLGFHNYGGFFCLCFCFWWIKESLMRQVLCTVLQLKYKTKVCLFFFSGSSFWRIGY